MFSEPVMPCSRTSGGPEPSRITAPEAPAAPDRSIWPLRRSAAAGVLAESVSSRGAAEACSVELDAAGDQPAALAARGPDLDLDTLAQRFVALQSSLVGGVATHVDAVVGSPPQVVHQEGPVRALHREDRALELPNHRAGRRRGGSRSRDADQQGTDDK